jgi:hypothetical protein
MNRGMFKVWFYLVGIVMVLGIIYNVFIFTDCMAAGQRAYQCNAAISNPSYIAVDDMGD